MTDVQSKINLLDLDRTGMVEFFTGLGEKRFRAEQVMKCMLHPSRCHPHYGCPSRFGEKVHKLAKGAPVKTAPIRGAREMKGMPTNLGFLES